MLTCPPGSADVDVDATLWELSMLSNIGVWLEAPAAREILKLKIGSPDSVSHSGMVTGHVQIDRRVVWASFRLQPDAMKAAHNQNVRK